MNRMRVMSLRNSVLFPGGVLPMRVGREKTIRLVQDALRERSQIAIVAQREAQTESPGPADLYGVGVTATIVQFTQNGDEFALVVQGQQRIRIVEWETMEPYGIAQVAAAPREPEARPPAEDESRLRDVARRLIASMPGAPPQAVKMVDTMPDTVALAEFVTANTELPTSAHQALLETATGAGCVRMAIELLEARAAQLGLPQAAVLAPRRHGSYRELLTDLRDVTCGGLVGMARSYGAIKERLFLEPVVPFETDGLPSRADIVTVSNDRATPLKHVSAGIPHEDLTFRHGDGLQVTLANLSWDSCRAVVASELPNSPIVEWYRRWFDAQGSRPADETGLHGVVHALSFSPGGFDVDFGSAPVDAFVELLDVLSASGVQHVAFQAGQTFSA